MAIPGPSYKPIANTYAKVQEISKSGTFSILAVYELLPLQKINSVPLNTTAYRRSTNPNCLLSLNWPRDLNSQALVDEARSLTHQLAACVAGGASELEDEKSRPYANYGMNVYPLILYVIDDIGCMLDAEGDARSQEEVKKIAHVAFGDNYPALQKIKKIYDPDNIFNRWFAITPA